MAHWRLPSAALLALAGLSPLIAHVVRAPSPTKTVRADARHSDARAALLKLPMSFEPNEGQTGKHVRYLVRGDGFTLFMTDRGSQLDLGSGSIVGSRLLGAARVRPTAEVRLPGVVNVYRGRTVREGIPTYGRVRYRSVYPGIDLLYHGRQRALEYDFQVAPGADPSRIAMQLGGARSLRIARNGDLVLRLAHGSIRQTRPLAYQEADGRRTAVAARYVLTRHGVRFDLGHYDRSRPLIIDPVLAYGTYFGGSSLDTITSLATGSDGSIFLAGGTHSATMPGHPSGRGFSDEDAFVTRIAPDGTSVIYTTFLGDQNPVAGWAAGFADDQVNDIVVSGTSANIVGGTKSTGYPQLANTEDYIGSCATSHENAFVTTLGDGGNVGYSSCFGGSGDEEAQSLVVRYIGGLSKRTVYAIAGWTQSTDFGNVSGGTNYLTGSLAPYQGTNGGNKDGFLAMVAFDNNPTCANSSSIACDFIWDWTYIGGGSNDAAYGVTFDSTVASTVISPAPGTPISPVAVVTGDTASANFPVSSGSALGGIDAWLARFGIVAGSPAGMSRTYSVRYGGSGDDSAYGVALDSSDHPYVVGSTTSGLAGSNHGGQDGFITKFDTSGNATNALLVGGTNDDSLRQIALQQNGSNVAEYAVGTTASGPSASFTPRNTVAGHTCTDGNTQALVVKRIDGASPETAVVACLGGNDADGDYGTAISVPASATNGTMLVAGNTGGGFAGMNGIQTTFAGGAADGFLVKLTQAAPSIDSGPADGSLVGGNSVAFHLSTADAGMHFGCSTPVANQLVAGARGTANCPAATATYSGLADGQHTFEATTLDDFGSESAPATRSFTTDATPPDAFDLTSPADGDQVHSTQPTLSWADTHDTHGVSYALVIDGNAVPTVAPPACGVGTCSAQPKDPVLNGSHTWKVVASDGATPPNARDSTSTRTFTVVDPVQARFTIAPNPALVGRAISFDGSASADATHAIANYQWDLDGNGTFETDGGTTPTTSRAFLTPGTVKVSLRVTAADGSIGTSTQDLHVNDPSSAAAQVGVSIDKGAQYTNDPNVTLTIVAPAATTGLLVSNDGGFAGALPQADAKEVGWKLDSSGPERLPKTVYVRFLSGPFASPNYTDDIILDERPPVVSSASVVGGPAAAAAARAARLRPWKLKVKASDTNSGVGSVQVTANKRNPGKLIAYRSRLTVKLGSRPRFLRARDRAGNYSAWKKLG